MATSSKVHPSPLTDEVEAIRTALLGEEQPSAGRVPGGVPPMVLLKIDEVVERTGLGHSTIYKLIGLGQFPAPIHLGGSRWIAAEVDEYLARKKDERDRLHGTNKFAPRPAILSHQAPATGGAILSGKSSFTPSPSTVRMLSPELVEALRTLKVDIPELYLDSSGWNVSLAVMKIEIPPTPAAKQDVKRKRR